MFLATTALESHWDSSQPILFLGEWCRRPSRKEAWTKLEHEVLSSPWDDAQAFDAAAGQVEAVTEAAFLALRERLAARHAVELPERAWRILLGPWLSHFVAVLADRAAHLDAAFRLDNDLETWTLATADRRYPDQTSDFIGWFSDDHHQLQLYSEILELCGRDFPARGASAASPARQGGSFKRSAAAALSRAALTASRRRARLAVCESGWGPRMALRVLVESGGRILPIRVPSSVPTARPRDDRTRQPLPLGDEGFARLASVLIPRHVPRILAEELRSLLDAGRRVAARAPRTLLASSLLEAHEVLKATAAVHVARGGRLVVLQHGGGYGVLERYQQEVHERRIADAYGTWGWGHVPPDGWASHPRLTALTSPTGPGARLLFVGTGHPRYLYRFDTTPVGSQWPAYFHAAGDFLRELPHDIREVAAYRAYPQDHGHDMRLRMREEAPGLAFDAAPDLATACGDARIVVVDHCATVYLQTLAADIPTVAFWDVKRWRIRAAAQPLFDDLTRAGIFHTDPAAAAAHVRSIWSHVDAWWSAPEVKAARAAFVSQHARSRPDWILHWRELYATPRAIGHARAS